MFAVAFVSTFLTFFAFGHLALSALVVASLVGALLLGFAAVLGAVVHATLAIFLLAGGVGAHAVLSALVVAFLFTNGSLGGIRGSLIGVLVAASRHTKSESNGDGCGKE